MTKLVYQLFLIGFVSTFLMACQSQENKDPEEEVSNALPSPTPQKVEQPVEIDETFWSWGASQLNELLGLYTFSAPNTDAEQIETREVHTVNRDMTLSLDTSGDNGAKPDVSIFVDNGTVFAIDHEIGELTHVRHYTNEICEIIPKEIVEKDVLVSGENTTEVLSVRHDMSIYVVTALSTESGSSCESSSASRYYHELPLNFEFDSRTEDPDSTNDIIVVNEALANAQLVFGWVEDEEGSFSLTYGYLGYSRSTAQLEFFDDEGNSIWVQDRNLAEYQSVNGSSSETYIFNVEALDDYQYLIQLNQDIFVVDATTEFLTKTQDDSESILTDRVLKLNSLNNSVNDAEFYYDSESLFLFDQGKIYSYSYQENAFSPESPSRTYQVSAKQGASYSADDLLAKPTVSQFDYQQCDDNNDACNEGHDVGGTNWQFVSECTSEVGCVIEEGNSDLCETKAELDVTQSGRDLCSPKFYLHLDELNNSENDAELLGFMQYLERAINDYSVSILNDSLLIAASMLEQDIIVQYFYKQPLSAPRSVRERVLFGAQSELYGLEHFVENNNLFINMLVPGAVRSNECYKGYRRVACDLASGEEGASDRCTGRDLSEGLCSSSFTEFESAALFCSQEQLMNRVCNDIANEQGELRVESATEDAKWIRLLDLTGDEQDKFSMFLLKSMHDDALQSQVLEEGRLLAPMLYEVEDSDGTLGLGLGALSETVETVLGGVIYQKASGAESLLEGFIDIIADDAVSAQLSQYSKYGIVNTLSSENNAVSVKAVPKLSESLVERVATTPRISASVSEEE